MRRAKWVLVVQIVTLTRFVSALLFACIAFLSVSRGALLALYGTAMITDLVDGYLAHRHRAETYLGSVLDLVSDKALTIVSLLYAAARGINLAPLAIIAARDIAMLGMRLVTVEGRQLLPTNRMFGGVAAATIWGATALLVLSPGKTRTFDVVEGLYWIAAAIVGANLVLRLRSSSDRIKTSLEADE